MSTMAAAEEESLLLALATGYKAKTAPHLFVIDAFLVCIALTGAIQLAYCLTVGTFPFNSFLSGFLLCVGMFVLTGEFLCAHALRGVPRRTSV